MTTKRTYIPVTERMPPSRGWYDVRLTNGKIRRNVCLYGERDNPTEWFLPDGEEVLSWCEVVHTSNN